MRQSARLTVLLCGTFLVTGCQLFQGNAARLQAGLRVPEQAEPRLYAQQQLEVGRAALASQNYAEAVAAFRNAALEPEFAAAAHNGLGVAYAGIGRNDLAERYFRLAIAEDSQVQRYQDNLVRLMRSNFAIEQARLARAAAEPPVPAKPLMLVRPGSTIRASLALATPTPQLTRTSAGGVYLGSRPPEPAVAAGSAVRPRREILPAVVVRDTGSPAVVLDQRIDPSGAETVPQPAVAAVSKPLTVIVPQTERPAAEAPAVQSTGRRYPQAEFARIFEPYSAGTARAPLMSAVSSPGLRPPVMPQPAFGQAEASENLALSGE